MLMERARKSNRKGLSTVARVGASAGMACWMAAYWVCTLGGTIGVSRRADLRPQGICMSSFERRLPQMVRAAAMMKMTVHVWRIGQRRVVGTALARRLKTT